MLILLLFKTWMRNKLSLIFGLLFPVMFLLVFGSIFGGPSPPDYRLYVRNLDVDENGNSGFLSEAFIQALNNSVFEVIKLKPDEPTPRSTGFAAIRILTIPKGFTSNLLNMTIANRVDITADTLIWIIEIAGGEISEEQRANIISSVEQMKLVKQLFPAEKKELILEGSRDDRVLQPVEGIINVITSKLELSLLNASATMEIKTEYSGVRQLRAVDYYLPGYIAAFITTNGLIGVSSLVADFRRRGVVKLLASTPVSKTTWIVSLVVVQTVVSLLLTSVMVLTGWIVFRITAFPDPFSVFIIFLGTLAFTGLGVLIGGVLKEAEAVTALGNSLSFPMMFLSGAFWPLELMPPLLQEVARYIPLYYFHLALRESLIVGSISTAIMPAAFVAFMAAAGLLLASITTRWRDF